MTIPAEVLAAFLLMCGTVLAAIITAGGVIVAKNLSGKVDKVYKEVTPNGGKSAHDELMRAIRAERNEAILEHETRLHKGTQQ